MGWDGIVMVIIGHRYSKSTFCANNYRRPSQVANQQMDAGQNKRIWESGLKPTTDRGCHTKFLAKNTVREAIPKNISMSLNNQDFTSREN